MLTRHHLPDRVVRRVRTVLSLGLVLLGVAAAIRGQPPGQPPVNREQMWPAPTADDWKRPVLIQWQRTWEDAVALSKETGKPILICVNMDGEIASEHYAGIRYREPEKAALYEPYVTVIASVYRHTPRDYDEAGRRIPCPRFGTVTCDEHMAIEPVLYEKFFDGRRIAPRHIMVELDGSETYDVYYTWDTDSVFNAIRDGIAKRAVTPPAVVRGDRTIVERVASRDSVDRSAVETAYEKGDRELRRALLEAALKNVDVAPDDLLRLAVFGFDPDMAKLARQALAQAQSVRSIDVINEALRVSMESTEREALIAALGRLGEAWPRARTLAVVHRGLGVRSTVVDVDGWSKELAGAEYPAPTERGALASRIDESAGDCKARPEDAAARLSLAEATLALAVDPNTAQTLNAGPRAARDYARLVFEDARRAALEAEKLGATGWRLDAAVAIPAYYLGDTEVAFARAEKAVNNLPAGAPGWNAMSVLGIFADARQQAIIEAVRRKEKWPPQWLTDVNSAYAVLGRHPLANENHVANHYDFLKWLGAGGQAARCLDDGVARFPESWLLHERLRGRLLQEKGVEGLEGAYDAMLQKADAPPILAWFAGYASIVAAEFHRRVGRNDPALAAYDRAIAHYERAIATVPTSRETADHYVALALAGRARLAYERGDYERAVAEIVASFERKPSAAATRDGLNLSPVDTAKMLLARLQEKELTGLASKLELALGNLAPELLELPDYEREVPPAGRERPRAGRRGR